jgi:hypothetical protein
MLAFAPAAHAYCPQWLCDGAPAEECSEHAPPCEGTQTVVRWPQRTILVRVAQDVPEGLSREQVHEAAIAAAQAWTSLSCQDGRSPQLSVQDVGFTSCGESCSAVDGIVTISFREPDSSLSETVLMTTVTYDEETGQLVDADIELNAAEAYFADAPGGGYHLPSVLLRGLGQALGLRLVNDGTGVLGTRLTKGSPVDLDDDDAAGV